MSRGVEHHELIRALDECFAAAITEHVRALLVDDEGTIEMMAEAAWRKADTCEELQDGFYEELRIAMRAALDALRRKAGIE